MSLFNVGKHYQACYILKIHGIYILVETTIAAIPIIFCVQLCCSFAISDRPKTIEELVGIHDSMDR